MFRRLAGRAENAAELERVERLVRERFSLQPQCLVLVSDEEIRATGFPPRNTLIRFWDEAGERYRLRVFKPVAEVAPQDLPVAWLMNAFVDDGEPDCC